MQMVVVVVGRPGGPVVNHEYDYRRSQRLKARCGDYDFQIRRLLSAFVWRG